MTLSVAILAVVLILIATRGIGRVHIQIWQAMLGGAAAMLASGQIGPRQALAAIDFDVMIFLFGMFVVGRAVTLCALPLWVLLVLTGLLPNRGPKWVASPDRAGDVPAA